MKRFDAIKELLAQSINPFAKLALTQVENLEFQVNVKTGIERIEGEFKGRRWIGYRYSDGDQAKPFRIPWKANSPEANYQDSPISHSLDKIEAIGSTGWDWRNKRSLWFGYDIDSITGHKAGLSDEEINEVINKIKELSYLNIITSKSGKGYHAYIILDKPVSTNTHTEHGALARSLLSFISSEIGFDLKSKTDVCGGNLWLYHDKCTIDGFKTLRDSLNYFSVELIPVNWKDHTSVISGKEAKVKFNDNIDELVGSINTPLDQGHKKLLKFLQENKSFSWWDHDRHMLVCHTADLKKAKQSLSLVGLFDTLSIGKEINDQNSFAFPLPNSGWIVRRHTKGVKEHEIWQDINGWTTTTLNVPPDLSTVTKINSGHQDEKGAFTFNNYQDALKALISLGVQGIELSGENATIPLYFINLLGLAKIFKLKNKSIMLVIECHSPVNPCPEGFIQERKKLKKIFNITLPEDDKYYSSNDKIIRHIISCNKDAGWAIKNEKGWIQEPKENISCYLLAKGAKDTNLVLGKAIENPWELVSLPFQPEYPGNRQWNKNAAQFSMIPNNTENIKGTDSPYPTWNLLFNHVGKGLNEAVTLNPWCKENGITNGGEYLKCWVATLFQEPLATLPYLFLFGPEGSAKSMFHEAISLFFKNQVGYVNGKNVLTNPQNFSGELLGGVLVYIEELNLRTNKGALERIKEYVTAKYINIHPKGGTPFDILNTTHWIQCANNPDFCPIMPGDTRITMIYVDVPENPVPKSEFLNKLILEAPAFLFYLLELEIPKAESRLRIPVIETQDKIDQQKENRNALEAFVSDLCYPIEGSYLSFNEFVKAFHDSMPDQLERMNWSTSKIGRNFPRKYPKGRYPGSNNIFIGNLSLKKHNPDGSDILPSAKWIQVEDRIYREGSVPTIVGKGQVFNSDGTQKSLINS